MGPESGIAAALELRRAIEDFHIRYADALDNGRVAEWPGFFTDDAYYSVIPRENFDGGMALGVMLCDGRPMFLDRVAALDALVFAPRYMRHFVSNIRILDLADDGAIAAQANYLLTQTAIDDETRIFQAGRYLDEFVRDGGTLKLRKRLCIYDSVLISNTIMFPI